MSPELRTLHEAQRLLTHAYAEKASEQARATYLEKQAFDSWILKLSTLTDNVIASEKVKDLKVAQQAKQSLKDAIRQHMNARQWHQIRGIQEHVEALEALIEAREYVVDRLMMRVEDCGEKMSCVENGEGKELEGGKWGSLSTGGLE